MHRPHALIGEMTKSRCIGCNIGATTWMNVIFQTQRALRSHELLSFDLISMRADGLMRLESVGAERLLRPRELSHPYNARQTKETAE